MYLFMQTSCNHITIITKYGTYYMIYSIMFHPILNAGYHIKSQIINSKANYKK